MRKIAAKVFAFCVLAALLFGSAAHIGVISGGAEGEPYLCTPVDFTAVYYPETEIVVCRGSYTGMIQPDRSYSIVAADAEGVMKTLLSPKGSEMDRGGGAFEYSFTFKKSEYDKCALPLCLTLRCGQPNVIKPVSATVVLPLLGDVNCDGAVDNMDAAKVLRYDAARLPYIDLGAADVNGDGAADNMDAAMILRYDAGLISGFEK